MEPSKQTNATTDASTAKARTLVDDLMRYSEESGVRLRYTTDESGAPERISVIDTVALFCECSNDAAGNKVRDFTLRERFPKLDAFIFSGSGQRQTPVARPSTLVEVINALPSGKYHRVDAFKKSCASLTVRYAGGDARLAAEVLSINDAYNSGAIAADSPLQAFRAEGAELGAQSAAALPNPRMEQYISIIMSMNENINKMMAQQAEQNQVVRTQQAQILGMTQTLREIKTVVANDRVLHPVDAGKRSLFILYATNSPNARVEYAVVRCMAENEDKTRRHILGQYPDAEQALRLEHPNANALFQVLKENMSEIGAHFYRTGFTLDPSSSIDTVISFIRRHEQRRRMLDDSSAAHA